MIRAAAGLYPTHLDLDKAGAMIDFIRFIALSQELDLPLNVHSGFAGCHVIALLLEKDSRQVKLHDHDGGPDWRFEAGYSISILRRNSFLEPLDAPDAAPLRRGAKC